MKCRKCIYLMGLRCVIQGKHVHSGQGPKCKYFTESVLDERHKEGTCTGSTAKKTESK